VCELHEALCQLIDALWKLYIRLCNGQPTHAPFARCGKRCTDIKAAASRLTSDIVTEW